ncbi:hypothetical protein C6W88_00630 [Halomonas litopenaei]|uniref:Uncharacterized protein n=1 Tax=Halomonas litopenaei TaxID=2109328 RepID=A0ABX5J3N7_9GAMM|nr:hypothetical protein C6W88_00630 [Halomonas litopenaei]
MKRHDRGFKRRTSLPVRASRFVVLGVDAFKQFCEDERKRAANEQAVSLFCPPRRELLKENP